MSGFWVGFNESLDKQLDRGLKEKLLNDELMSRRRENLLGLAGSIAKKRADRNTEVENYSSSVMALRQRLTDEEGNLVPGAEAFLDNPQAAHMTLEQIMKIEQDAAKDDNSYIPPLQGETIVDYFSVYDASQGGRIVTPDVDIEELMFTISQDGDITPEEEAAYMAQMNRAIPVEVEQPAPTVVPSKELFRKPNPETLKAGNEAYQASVVELLTVDLTNAKDSDDFVRAEELQSFYDDIMTNKDKAVSWSTLNEMYGAQAYAQVKKLSEQSPYIMNIDQNPFLAKPRMYYDVSRARRQLENPDLPEEKKNKIRVLMKERYGVDL